MARKAGISKRTLYARYADKRAVFLDVVPWALSRSVATKARPRINDDDLRTALTAIARGALKHALDPDIVRLHLIARNESARFPEYSISAETLGWSGRQRQVMDLLERHLAEGLIEVDDLELTAENFLAMVELIPARLAEFGVYRSRRQQNRHLEHAINLFMRGIAAH